MITSQTPTRNTFTRDFDFSQLRLSIREMANINFQGYLCSTTNIWTFWNNWSECFSTEVSFCCFTIQSRCIICNHKRFRIFPFPTMSEDVLYFLLSRLANFILWKYFLLYLFRGLFVLSEILWATFMMTKPRNSSRAEVLSNSVFVTLSHSLFFALITDSPPPQAKGDS